MEDYIRRARLVTAGFAGFERTEISDSALVALPCPANLNAPVNADPVESGASRTWYHETGKRILDLSLLILTFPISALIVAICAVALWIESGAPFYTQLRLGRNGRQFRIFKLRTMVRDADTRLEELLAADPELRAEWDRTQKLKSDPRITPVGGFLRATSLDELPQLWNVLRGEMSLVGPRPMMPEQLPLYDQPQVYFSMRPGITGEWQVSARNENSFGFRSHVDAAYAQAISFWHDLVLLWRTVGVVVRRTGY